MSALEQESQADATERFREALRAAGIGFPIDRLSLLHRAKGVRLKWRDGEPSVPLDELAGMIQAGSVQSEAEFFTHVRGFLGHWSKGRPMPPIFSTHHGR